MLGTRDHAGIALAGKLDARIRDKEQRVGVLAERLAQAMHEVQQHRELRALLDQVLDEHSEPHSPVDLTPSPVGVVPTDGSATTHVATAGETTSPIPTAEPTKPDPLGQTNPAPIAEVYRVLTDRPGQVVSAAEVRRTFPAASSVQINDRLGRLVRQGKIDRIEGGRYRFPPTTPAELHSGRESTEDTHGTAREQIGMILRQDPSRGWRPKDIADVVKPKMNDDYLRSVLREMLHRGELMQDNAGLYWAPRPPAIVLAQPDDRQAIMI
jgi:hypothetical protein